MPPSKRIESASRASYLQQAWLRQVRQEYEAICFQYRLDMPAPLFVLGDSGTTLGAWNSTTRELTLSGRLISTMAWTDTVQILKHEMAHQICTDLFKSPAAGHGPAFQRACTLLGLEKKFRGARIDCTGLHGLRQQDRGEKGDHRHTILTRVEKLFALAGSDNEHEAALAMERAWQLLRRYNLDSVGQQTRYRRSVIVTGLKRMPAHLKHICLLVQEYFFVQVICASTYLPEEDRVVKTVELFGRPANVDVAVHCYHFLLERIEWLWRQNRGRFHPHARQARSSYLRGLVSGFAERLEQAGRQYPGVEEEQPGLLPVCLRADSDPALRDFVAGYYPRLVRRRGRRTRFHDQAYREAVAEGRKIVLHKVVAEQKSGCGLLR
jgi:hypothetical protein